MEATADKPRRKRSKRVHPVRAYRKANGLSQVQLAEQVGVTQQVICHWENSISIPGPVTLPKLAYVLKRDGAELLREITAFVPEKA